MTVERAGRNLEYWAGVMVSLGRQTFVRLTWCRLGLLRCQSLCRHTMATIQHHFRVDSIDRVLMLILLRLAGLNASGQPVGLVWVWLPDCLWLSVDCVPIVRPPGIYSYLLNALSLFDIDPSSAVCPFHFWCAQIHGHVDLSSSGARLACVGDTAAGGPWYWCTERVEPSILGDRQSGLGISLLWVRRLFARP